MSEATPTTPAEADLLDAPYESDDERAEAAWLLAREHDPAAPPPSATAERDYAELEDMLTSLPSGLADASWQEGVLRAAAALSSQAAAAPSSASASEPPPSALPRAAVPLKPRRTMLRWVAVGGGVTALAASALVILRSPASALVVEMNSGGKVRGDHHPGDSHHAAIDDKMRAVVTLPAGTPGELRVYRGDRDAPIVRCPSDPAEARAARADPRCRSPEPGKLIIDMTFDAPGTYDVVLLVGASAVRPDATLEEFLGAAANDVPPNRWPPIDVR